MSDYAKLVDDTKATLARIARDFAPAVFASSLAAEDMVLTDLILRFNRHNRFRHHVGGCEMAGFLVNFGDILRLDKLVKQRGRANFPIRKRFLFQKKIVFADHADHLALPPYNRRAADSMLLE